MVGKLTQAWVISSGRSPCLQTHVQSLPSMQEKSHKTTKYNICCLNFQHYFSIFLIKINEIHSKSLQTSHSVTPCQADCFHFTLLVWQLNKRKKWSEFLLLLVTLLSQIILHFCPDGFLIKKEEIYASKEPPVSSVLGLYTDRYKEWVSENRYHESLEQV